MRPNPERPSVGTSTFSDFGAQTLKSTSPSFSRMVVPVVRRRSQ